MNAMHPHEMIIFRPPPELKFKELNMVTGTKYDIDAEEKAQPPADLKIPRIPFTGFRNPMTPTSFPRMKKKDIALQIPPEPKPHSKFRDPLTPHIYATKTTAEIRNFSNPHPRKRHLRSRSQPQPSRKYDSEAEKRKLAAAERERRWERWELADKKRLAKEREKEREKQAQMEARIGTLSLLDLNLDNTIHHRRPSSDVEDPVDTGNPSQPQHHVPSQLHARPQHQYHIPPQLQAPPQFQNRTAEHLSLQGLNLNNTHHVHHHTQPGPASDSDSEEPADIGNSYQYQYLIQSQLQAQFRGRTAELARLISTYNRARKCVWDRQRCKVGMYGYNCFSVIRSGDDAVDPASPSPSFSSSSEGMDADALAKAVFTLDRDIASLRRLRVDYIGAHMLECHGLECRERDKSLIACRACAVANVSPTYVSMEALPEHLNTYH
ncbi:hypothetical protein CVT25_006588 [Psilocybe cyanescens]|uniref:Uncharacterized protein n=1 Tax=Psilocybe cyanescens TaxID=93625 RepID=A0A409X424_PSICY|nr:hypothetical protein CVT25_006588 [Psilocybe cyanescens]